MSKKWTEGYPRDNAIADYKQFNQGYNSSKGSLNGGIDRTMTPVNVFTEARRKDKAFHYVQIFRRGDNTALQDNAITAPATDFKGITYNTYGGGWVTVDEFGLSVERDSIPEKKDGIIDGCDLPENTVYLTDSGQVLYNSSFPIIFIFGNGNINFPPLFRQFFSRLINSFIKPQGVTKK